MSDRASCAKQEGLVVALCKHNPGMNVVPPISPWPVSLQTANMFTSGPAVCEVLMVEFQGSWAETVS